MSSIVVFATLSMIKESVIGLRPKVTACPTQTVESTEVIDIQKPHLVGCYFLRINAILLFKVILHTFTGRSHDLTPKISVLVCNCFSTKFDVFFLRLFFFIILRGITPCCDNQQCQSRYYLLHIPVPKVTFYYMVKGIYCKTTQK